ncbi:hypothetical protein E2C01_083202 [Portunus trituberculatus]|uniref:Uncharacterized protein n=1 Tax=Portunus trituberculatus TaxID=210409 RepID=A0A5B7IRU7_PORTR|nr:hypothetical protein [Portunus trituberculatus]
MSRANPSSGPTIRVDGVGRGLPVRTHSDVGPFYEGETLNLSCSVTDVHSPVSQYVAPLPSSALPEGYSSLKLCVSVSPRRAGECLASGIIEYLVIGGRERGFLGTTRDLLQRMRRKLKSSYSDTDSPEGGFDLRSRLQQERRLSAAFVSPSRSQGGKANRRYNFLQSPSSQTCSQGTREQVNSALDGNNFVLWVL